MSAHLFYQGDLDRLLVEAVHPLVDRLAGEGTATASFFLRYWEGGNHLRLRVRVPDPVDRPAARQSILAAARAFFVRCPSRDVIGPDDYRRLAGALGAGEQLTAWADSLQPNNSVAFLEYRREYERYRPGAGMVAVEEHFAESSALALQVLLDGAAPSRRQGLALALLVGSWSALLAEDDELVVWARALLDVWARQGPGLLGAVPLGERAAVYGRLRDQLLVLGATARAAAAAPHETSGPLGAWIAAVVRLRDALLAECDAGRPPPATVGFGAVPIASLSGRSAQVLPTLDICAHLMCNRLGLSIPQEYQVRYLAARTALDLAYGEVPA